MDLQARINEIQQSEANNLSIQALDLIDRIRGDYQECNLELSYLFSDLKIDYLIAFAFQFRNLAEQVQKTARFPTPENREILNKMIIDLRVSHGIFLHKKQRGTL